MLGHSFLLKHAYFLVVMLMRDGIDFSKSCEILGLPIKPMNQVDMNDRISAESMFNACSALNHHYGDNLKCFSIGFSIQSTNYSLWGQLVSHSSTLREAWASFIDNFERLGNFGKPALFEGDSLVTLASYITDEELEGSELLLELRTTAMMRVNQLLSREMFPDLVQEIHFQHAKSASIDLYEKTSKCKVIFNSDFTGLVLLKKYFDLEILNPDPVLKKIVLSKVNSVDTGIDHSSVTKSVSSIIANTLPSLIKQSEVAALLEMSVSSLKRRLTQENITYQEILDNSRNQKAKNLLMTTSKSMQNISDELGFTSLSSFSQTFRRLNQQAPSQFRKRR